MWAPSTQYARRNMFSVKGTSRNYVCFDRSRVNNLGVFPKVIKGDLFV